MKTQRSEHRSNIKSQHMRPTHAPRKPIPTSISERVIDIVLATVLITFASIMYFTGLPS